MKNLREKQIEEALFRMKVLGLHANTIEEIQADPRVVNKSIGDGILFWLNDEEKEKIKEFEEKHSALVYHVIENDTEFGVLKTLMYVSRTPREWPRDRKDLHDGYAFVYVINESEPAFSEFGSIGFKPLNGGLARTY